MSHAKAGNLSRLRTILNKERAVALLRGRERLMEYGKLGAQETKSILKESLASRPLLSDSPLKVASQVYLDNIGAKKLTDGTVYVGPKDDNVGSVDTNLTGLILEFGSSKVEPHPHYDKAARVVIAQAKKDDKKARQ